MSTSIGFLGTMKSRHLKEHNLIQSCFYFSIRKTLFFGDLSLLLAIMIDLKKVRGVSILMVEMSRVAFLRLFPFKFHVSDLYFVENSGVKGKSQSFSLKPFFCGLVKLLHLLLVKLH